MDTHQLVGETDAAEGPHDDKDDVNVQKDTCERKGAVETGGNVSVWVHHHRVSSNIEVRRGGVTHGKNHVVLSFNGNIVVHCDIQRIATANKSMK